MSGSLSCVPCANGHTLKRGGCSHTFLSPVSLTRPLSRLTYEPKPKPGPFRISPTQTAHSLVGLLSFMCADEMTTGSVSSTSADRQVFARQSHGWNAAQKRFAQLFPEYAAHPAGAAKDLPNMGAKAGEGSSGNAKEKGNEGQGQGELQQKVR